MTARPTVSVVMAAWNAEPHLAEALASVAAQTTAPLEVVVVDDGSTDGTAAVAERHGATVLRREHRGVGCSRNDGIATSTGEVVAFLDADDLWLPTKLERQLDVLVERPDVDAVACLLDEFLDERHGPAHGVRAPVSEVAVALPSNTIVRRTLVDQVGPFDEHLEVADWVSWWARARRVGAVEHIVPEVLVRRRIHGANNSARVRDGGARFLQIAREHRRAQRGST